MTNNSELKILVIGKSGQVGWELQRVLASIGRVSAIDYPQVDLMSADSIRKALAGAGAHIIINAAAYTAVDKAEAESERANAINGVAPGVLAEVAKSTRALLVHYSTDYVFDGTKSGCYDENDLPSPLNVYGRSKAAGDRAVQAVGGSHMIFRLTWVYSSRCHNFVRTMLKLGTQRAEISVVDDQVGSPTAARYIAQATGQALQTALVRADQNPERIAAAGKDLSGVYNLACAGFVSWCGFAKAIFNDNISQQLCGRRPAIVPISSADYPVQATRPLNSRLSTRKVREVFGIRMPDWQTAMGMTLEEIAENPSLIR